MRLIPRPRRDKQPPLWKRVLQQHNFLYATVLTAVVGVLVAAAVPWFGDVTSPDLPEISVSDSSDTLSDLSYVFADRFSEAPALFRPARVLSGDGRLGDPFFSFQSIEIADSASSVLEITVAADGNLLPVPVPADG
jgi:hypothetical protein